MGLDTTHDAWHGAYSSFNSWRTWLATQIGINLREMEGFTTNGIKWDTVNDDLKSLLNHSDCDGHLSSTECKKIANRLNTIVETLEHKDEYPSKDYNWHIAKAKQFAKGCMSAYNEKEQLKFQ